MAYNVVPVNVTVYQIVDANNVVQDTQNTSNAANAVADRLTQRDQRLVNAATLYAILNSQMPNYEAAVTIVVLQRLLSEQKTRQAQGG